MSVKIEAKQKYPSPLLMSVELLSKFFNAHLTLKQQQ